MELKESQLLGKMIFCGQITKKYVKVMLLDFAVDEIEKIREGLFYSDYVGGLVH